MIDMLLIINDYEIYRGHFVRVDQYYSFAHYADQRFVFYKRGAALRRGYKHGWLNKFSYYTIDKGMHIYLEDWEWFSERFFNIIQYLSRIHEHQETVKRMQEHAWQLLKNDNLNGFRAIRLDRH
jgi:hypothetical protein